MTEEIYGVRAIGNFWDAGRYQQSLDVFWVLASSPKEADRIARDNIQAVTNMFKEKIRPNKKPSLRKKETVLVRVVDSATKLSGSRANNKVLTSDGIFIPINLNEREL